MVTLGFQGLDVCRKEGLSTLGWHPMLTYTLSMHYSACDGLIKHVIVFITPPLQGMTHLFSGQNANLKVCAEGIDMSFPTMLGLAWLAQ